MGFKENLKAQLLYADLQVKELATLSGVKKRTIDSYLNAQRSIPSAEAAVAIARALGVTVEYLVTGEKAGATLPLTPALHGLVQAAQGLERNEVAVVLDLIESLKNHNR
jgi:transcriptional regulator with XRE-family HTH domain